MGEHSRRTCGVVEELSSIKSKDDISLDVDGLDFCAGDDVGGDLVVGTDSSTVSLGKMLDDKVIRLGCSTLFCVEVLPDAMV